MEPRAIKDSSSRAPPRPCLRQPCACRDGAQVPLWCSHPRPPNCRGPPPHRLEAGRKGQGRGLRGEASVGFLLIGHCRAGCTLPSPQREETLLWRSPVPPTPSFSLPRSLRTALHLFAGQMLFIFRLGVHSSLKVALSLMTLCLRVLHLHVFRKWLQPFLTPAALQESNFLLCFPAVLMRLKCWQEGKTRSFSLPATGLPTSFLT